MIINLDISVKTLKPIEIKSGVSSFLIYPKFYKGILNLGPVLTPALPPSQLRSSRIPGEDQTFPSSPSLWAEPLLDIPGVIVELETPLVSKEEPPPASTNEKGGEMDALPPPSNQAIRVEDCSNSKGSPYRKASSTNEERAVQDEYLAYKEERITIYDPVHNRAAKSPTIPYNFRYAGYSQCFCVDQKLIVIGLEHEKSEKRSTVMVYDFMSFRWRRGAEMPIDIVGHRLLALCASPEGLVYVVTSCKEAAVYDVLQDKWDRLPEMPDSVVWPIAFNINGMFHVVNISRMFSTLTYRIDPMIQRWQVLQRFELLRFSPLSFEVAFGRVYSFGGHQLMEFDCLKKRWFKVGCLPPYLDCLASPQLEFKPEILLESLPDRPKSTTWSYNTSLVFIEI
ncbi:hypothetical protein SUGI_0707490 [Cryptomeria japonica]|nr:hypothetical protein SUGI_0707490 [Cryptomeria japonica]